MNILYDTNIVCINYRFDLIFGV